MKCNADNPDIHTQNIENMWMRVNWKIRQQFITSRALFQTYLSEFRWRNFHRNDDKFNAVKTKYIVPTVKSSKMTAGPIKALGFQDRLSGIALSFDFVNFVIKIKLVRDLPLRPCLVSSHVGEVLLFHWPFKGILSDSIFFPTSDFGYYDWFVSFWYRIS